MTVKIGKEAFYRQAEMAARRRLSARRRRHGREHAARDADEGIGAFIDKRAPEARRERRPAQVIRCRRRTRNCGEPTDAPHPAWRARNNSVTARPRFAPARTGVRSECHGGAQPVRALPNMLATPRESQPMIRATAPSLNNLRAAHACVRPSARSPRPLSPQTDRLGRRLSDHRGPMAVPDCVSRGGDDVDETSDGRGSSCADDLGDAERRAAPGAPAGIGGRPPGLHRRRLPALRRRHSRPRPRLSVPGQEGEDDQPGMPQGHHAAGTER